jgi:uncharacterized protein
MFLKVEDIGLAGLTVEEPVDAALIEEWLGAGSVYSPAGDAIVKLTAEFVGQSILVRGELAAKLGAECSGCLKDLELNASVPFTALFAERNPVVPDGGEEGGGTDEEMIFFSGPIVEMDDVLRDALLLSLPMAPRCTEGCKGLCPTCGADLNSGSCGCPGPMNVFGHALKDRK